MYLFFIIHNYKNKIKILLKQDRISVSEQIYYQQWMLLARVNEKERKGPNVGRMQSEVNLRILR